MQHMTTFGPPGTGKTYTFVHDVLRFLEQGMAPEMICAATFTKMAAKEFRSRLMRDAGLDENAMSNMRTMHSLCYRLVGLSRSQVASNHLREFVEQYPMYPMGERQHVGEDGMLEPLDESTEETFDGDVLLNLWGFIRNCNHHSIKEGLAAGAFPQTTDVTPHDAERFVERYEDWKHQHGYLDFTDMLTTVRDNHLSPYCRVYLLDEAQDMTPLQWAIWDQWTAGAEHVGLYGDDDQTLYGFLGARARDFLHHTTRGGITVLGQSYRCPRAIVRMARGVIERNKERQWKEYAPRDADGHRGHVLYPRWAFRGDVTTPTFVLARHRYLLDAVVRELVDDGIPFSNRRGVNPLRTKAAKGAIAAAQLHLGNPITWREWLLLVECLPATGEAALLERGAKNGRQYAEARDLAQQQNALQLWDLVSLGATPVFYTLFARDWVNVLRLHVSEQQRSYLRRVFDRYDIDGLLTAPAITLSTVHGVKGEERERVVLLTDLSKRAWDEYQTNPESERRVLYVGLTRARQSVVIVEPQGRRCWQEMAVG